MMSFLSSFPSIVSQAPAVTDKLASDTKKQGIASMLSGIGKGKVDENMRLRPLPQQEGFDLQGFLASLFGG